MARLTAAARRALPDSAFADPVHRAYPMNDPGHIKAAKSMVQAHGTASQQRQVAHKAASKGMPFKSGRSMSRGGR